jgi:hypothetical protein
MSMNLSAAEIDTIEEIGTLDGNAIRMVRTKGGLHIAIGKKRGGFGEEALAMGSHPAIVKFQLEKQCPGFQPAMMKSEDMSDPSVVEKHSHFLPEDLRKSGHDIYSVQVGNNIDFHITKHNVRVVGPHGDLNVNGELNSGSLVVKTINIPKEFSRALAGAVSEKAVSCGAAKIKIEGK